MCTACIVERLTKNRKLAKAFVGDNATLSASEAAWVTMWHLLESTARAMNPEVRELEVTTRIRPEGMRPLDRERAVPPGDTAA